MPVARLMSVFSQNPCAPNEKSDTSPLNGVLECHWLSQSIVKFEYFR